MRQIQGYEDGTNRVLRLIGSLYGLKQAPRIWYRLFHEKVRAIGYQRLPSEQSVFIRRQGGDVAILAVYVDDIAVFATRGTGRKVQKELMGLFDMRDLGELNSFLGYRISRDGEQQKITVSQDRYIRSII